MDNELLPDYLAEAEDRIDSIYKSIGKIDQSGISNEILNELLRDIHSLKAAANATGLENSAKLLHKTEDCLELIRDGKIEIDETILEVLYASTDEILSIAKTVKPDDENDGDSFILIDKLDLYISIATGIEMEAEKEVKKRMSVPQKTETEPELSQPQADITPSPVVVDLPEKEENVSTDQNPELIKELQEADEPIDIFCPTIFTDEELLVDIIEDVSNILEDMANHAVELEKSPDNKEMIDRVFREIHTIKGDSSMVPIPQISKLAHYIEHILNEVRDGIYPINTNIMDMVLEGIELLEKMIDLLKNNEDLDIDIRPTLKRLVYTNLLSKSIISEADVEEGLFKKGFKESQPNKKEQPEETPPTVEIPETQKSLSSETEKILKQKIKEFVESDSPVINQIEEPPIEEKPVEPESKPEPVPPIKKEPAKSSVPQKGVKKVIQTLRVDIGKLDSGMNLVSELVTNKIRFDERLKHLVHVLNLLDKNFRALSSMKIYYQNSKFIDELERKLISRTQEMNMQTKELENDISQTVAEYKDRLLNFQGNVSKQVHLITEKLKVHISDAEETSETLINTMDSLSSITTGLQDNLMKIRMLPVSTVFNRFPRMVRDLARDCDKEVNLIIKGEETELDKNVIEEIGDPILHILRNSIDHGLENKKERETAGKDKVGTLIMNAYYEGNQVIIEVSDDGYGINSEKVKQKAIEKGILTPSEANSRSEMELRELIFSPGFSTAAEVTDISGRGVGLDVVKSNITKLKGTIDLESKIGVGTTFKIRLPLTLAVLHSLLIKVQKETFAIPLSFVEKTIVLSANQIQKTGNSTVINYLGETVPIFRLSDILDLGNDLVFNNSKLPVIVVNIGKNKFALLVDELLGRLEVVIKTLGDLLKKVKHVTGATIMGDGRVIIILDIPSIISSAYSQRSGGNFGIEKNLLQAAYASIDSEEESDEEQTDIAPLTNFSEKDRQYVLVVEDSNTVRKSIVNSLKKAGYDTLEACDGQQGLDMALKHSIRLFTVDIMMPIMDGYTLTKRLRELDQYKKTPILIISSKDKKVDKVKGLEAGADEYITKPFEKNQLIVSIQKRMGTPA